MLNKGTLKGRLGQGVYAFDWRKALSLRSQVHGDEAEHDGFAYERKDKGRVPVKLVDSGEREPEFCLDKDCPGPGFKDEVGNMKVSPFVSKSELVVERPAVSCPKAPKPFSHFPLIPKSLPGGWVLRPWHRGQRGHSFHSHSPTVRE